MEREEALTILRTHKQELAAKYGVERLGLFGSLAHNQASAGSDVDIVVVMPPDLFQMVHVKEDLETLLAAPVDLIRYSKYLNDLLRKRIEREAIYV
jgi:predicted nucleotidyltransferase